MTTKGCELKVKNVVTLLASVGNNCQLVTAEKWIKVSNSPTFNEQLLPQNPFAKKLQTKLQAHKSCTKSFCMKKLLVKYWWNWHQVSHTIEHFSNTKTSAFVWNVWHAGSLFLLTFGSFKKSCILMTRVSLVNKTCKYSSWIGNKKILCAKQIFHHIIAI